MVVSGILLKLLMSVCAGRFPFGDLPPVLPLLLSDLCRMCQIGEASDTSSSPFDLRGVSVTGEAGSDDLARAGAGRLSLIQRHHGGARPLDRRRAALLRGLPGPAPGRQRLLCHG